MWIDRYFNEEPIDAEIPLKIPNFWKIFLVRLMIGVTSIGLILLVLFVSSLFYPQMTIILIICLVLAVLALPVVAYVAAQRLRFVAVVVKGHDKSFILQGSRYILAAMGYILVNDNETYSLFEPVRLLKIQKGTNMLVLQYRDEDIVIHGPKFEVFQFVPRLKLYLEPRKALESLIFLP